MTPEVHASPGALASLAALEAWHHERTQLMARIVHLEAVLGEHGIPHPLSDPALGVSAADHLEQCKAVVSRAYDLLDELDRLRELVGSSMELMRPMRRAEERP